MNAAPGAVSQHDHVLDDRGTDSSCGGCETSAACGACSVPTSDPDHQKYEWATLMTPNARWQYAFWRTAAIAESYFRADAGGGTPSPASAITEVVRLRQHVA